MKRIALVGLGYIGKAHLEAYEKIDNCRVTAIVTRKKAEDPALAKRYSGCFIEDFDAMLLEKEIDIVDICLPTYLHEEFIIKAANAGKHVICEKPLTLSLASARRIFKAMEKNGVLLFVGHVLRFWPEYKEIKRACEKAPFSEIDFIRTERIGQAPDWSEWFRNPEKSGGVLYDLLIHDIDFIQHLYGKASSVYAAGSRNERGAWDHVNALIKFKKGKTAIAEASHRMPPGFPFTMGFRAIGSGAAIEYRFSGGVNIEKRGETAGHLTLYKDGKRQEVHPEILDPFQAELAYFLGCIDQGLENTVIPLEEVEYTLKLLEAIGRSLDLGCEVPL